MLNIDNLRTAINACWVSYKASPIKGYDISHSVIYAPSNGDGESYIIFIFLWDDGSNEFTIEYSNYLFSTKYDGKSFEVSTNDFTSEVEDQIKKIIVEVVSQN